MFDKPGYYEITKGDDKGIIGEVGFCSCEQCVSLLAENKCKVCSRVGEFVVWKDAVRFIGGSGAINDAFESFEKGVRIADLPGWFESALRTHYRSYAEDRRAQPEDREQLEIKVIAVRLVPPDAEPGVPLSERD